MDSWKWQKQLRFYLGNNNVAKIAMADAEFDYTYEYQGNAPKLVHTPLTDKCYLTLTQGTRLFFVFFFRYEWKKMDKNFKHANNCFIIFLQP